MKLNFENIQTYVIKRNKIGLFSNDWTFDCFWNIIPGAFERRTFIPGSTVSAWAVSYTHLDVYKRQIVLRAIMINRIWTLKTPSSNIV